MTTGTVDYASSYFKYKTPTPIIGTPTNKTLKRLKQELRANAASVESDLGGGDHGYLGLILTDVEYALVSDDAFVAPNYPDPLTIPAGTDPVAALTIRERYKEDKKAYYECKNVEKSLQRHVQDAIEDKYLDMLIDEDTQLINEDIPTVLTYLFDLYGKIPSEEVKQKETEIRAMIYNPADPLILLYNPIEKLKTMAISADIPYTNDQLLDIGLTVIRNTRDFEQALGDWEAKPDADKTWDNYKEHFKTAQKQLKAIRGPTMQQAGYHHANHLAQRLREDIHQRDTELMSVIQTAMTTSTDVPSVAPSDISMSTTSPQVTGIQHHANVTQTDPVQVEMLKLLQQMQQSFASTNQSERGTGRRRQNRKTPDDATRPRTQTDKYCWTHGACAHHSAECRFKATGHQDNATKDNKLNGSKAYCDK